MSAFSGQQIAQVDNPDPFAVPVWRSPVYHTPGWIITIVQLYRLVFAVIRFLVRHPVLDLALAALAGSWYRMGWLGPVVLVLSVAELLAIGNKALEMATLAPITRYPVTHFIHAHQLYQQALALAESVTKAGG